MSSYDKKNNLGNNCNNIVIYYMAMSQKDGKQTNSRIWLAKIVLKKLQTKNIKKLPCSC